MSDEAIRDLTFAVRDLTVATRALTRELLARSPVSVAGPATGFTPVPRVQSQILEGSRVPFPEHFASEGLRLLHRGLEDGAPEVPDFVFDFARSRISNKAPGLQVRVETAYKAGFWAKIALATVTAYQPRELPAGATCRHWVVLRSTFGDPFRANCLRDFRALCDVADPDILVETFESISECEIFCLGAGVPVPCLQGCRSSN